MTGATGGTGSEETLLEVRDLRVTYRAGDQALTAVSGVTFDLRAGELLGVVGESGSGKSSAFLAMLGLLRGDSTAVSGQVLFNGNDLLDLSERQLRRVRGAEIAMVFQDSLSSLHPMYTIGWQLAEAQRLHGERGRRANRRRSVEALELVGIPRPETRLRSYPHELSGGQRQRVMIALALLLRPTIVFADEPTTALDVTVQSQILDLLDDVREQSGTTVVLITHDLAVVAERADRAVVMYAGKVMETAPTPLLFEAPRHPYTRGLIRAVPRVDRSPGHSGEAIPGAPPSAREAVAGCPFEPRCQIAVDRCRVAAPGLSTVASERTSACYRWDDVLPLETREIPT